MSSFSQIYPITWNQTALLINFFFFFFLHYWDFFQLHRRSWYVPESTSLQPESKLSNITVPHKGTESIQEGVDYTEAKSRLLWSFPWDTASETTCTVDDGRRVFYPIWIVPWSTRLSNKKMHSQAKKVSLSQKCSSSFNTIYVSVAKMAVTSAQKKHFKNTRNLAILTTAAMFKEI